MRRPFSSGSSLSRYNSSVAVQTLSSRTSPARTWTEDRAPYPDHRRTLGDGGLIIAAHPHRADAETCAIHHFPQLLEHSTGIDLRRRDRHQTLHVAPEGP